MPLGIEKVNESTKVLHDTGCKSIVRREFVNEDFTGSMGYVMAIDYALKEIFIAKIKMDAPYFTRATQAICCGILCLTF